MAATVYTGTGNWNYTNNTGGNVRVIIAYVYNNFTSQSYDEGIAQIVNGTEIARGTSGTNQNFVGFGKHILYQSTNGANGYQVKGIAGNAGGPFVDEFFLADGQTASIEAVNAGFPIKHYNIMVVPEGN